MTANWPEVLRYTPRCTSDLARLLEQGAAPAPSWRILRSGVSKYISSTRSRVRVGSSIETSG